MYKYLFVLFLFISCSSSEEFGLGYYSTTPISEAEIVNDMVVNETYTIKISYIKNTTCMIFDKVVTESRGNEHIITVQNYINESQTCQATNELMEVGYDFKPTTTGTHTLKFWKGKNANLEDQFIEININVYDN